MTGETLLGAARRSPWRLRNEIRRRLSVPWVRVRFALAGVRWGRGWRVLGMPMIQRHRGSSIELGERLSLRSWPASNPLSPNHPVVLATRSASAEIRVGNDCGFTGVTIVAASSVRIGDRVLVGSNSTIVDTDFHPLDPDVRRVNINAGDHAPVVVEDDVFIGMNCLILKGVTVGRGSVVGAGSVVTRDVPPGTIVAGNPARVVGPVPSSTAGP